MLEIVNEEWSDEFTSSYTLWSNFKFFAKNLKLKFAKQIFTSRGKFALQNFLRPKGLKILTLLYWHEPLAAAVPLYAALIPVLACSVESALEQKLGLSV